MRRMVVIASLALVGCSFLGLSDYEVKQCDVSGGSGDPCPELCYGDARCSSCKTFRCNVPARRCDLVDVDVDGDFDPPVACGGTDCDDTNAQVFGRNVEKCNGVDDNCDGNVDEGFSFLVAPPNMIALEDSVSDPVIVRDRATQSTLASFMRLNGSKPPCVLIVSDTDVVAAGDCTLFSVDPGRARQPYSRLLGQSFPPIVATVYSRTDTCGGLSFRTTAGGAIDLGCSDPATLPAIIGLDDYAFNAIVTYYAAPIATSCADVKPAKLLLRQIVNARQATSSVMGLVELSPASASLRPPAFATAYNSGTLIVAPDEATGVGFWFVTEPETAATTVSASIAHVELGTSLVGARSVDVAIARPNNLTQNHLPFAVVAEIGCPPMQRVAMVLGTMSVGEPNGISNAQLGEPFDIGIGGQDDASPSIVWEPEPYREWRVSFMIDGKVFVQRVSADGKLFEGPIDALPKSLGFGAVSALGMRSNVFAASSNHLSDIAETVALGCKP